MSILNDISEMLQKGKAKDVKRLVQEALDSGISASTVLNDGLLAGMSVIGEKFKNNDIFVPDVLIAARAMKMGSLVLKPYLSEEGVKAQGTVVIGTVQGDLHDIGKNLVTMMMEGKGLEVIDMGVDTPPERFVETAIENNADIIACSALLTTTMNNIKVVVDAVKNAGIRDKVTIMVGGAPLTEQFAKSVGADIYTPDAATAADAALAAVQMRN